MFDGINITTGELPPWVNQAVALARPVLVNMTVAIPALGAFSVGVVAYYDPVASMHMVKASTEYLRGIPDSAWGAIAAIAVGYTVSKSAENVKRHQANTEAGRQEPVPEPEKPRIFDTSQLPRPAPEFAPGGATPVME